MLKISKEMRVHICRQQLNKKKNKKKIEIDRKMRCYFANQKRIIKKCQEIEPNRSKTFFEGVAMLQSTIPNRLV